MKKAIIWGHKLHSHTHSYIHNSYFKAFKKMGYETYWFDDNDDVSSFDFNNCIFLTEGQVDRKIPLLKSSHYIIHHCDKSKYQNFNYTNLCNYVNDCKIGKSYNYPDSEVEKINYFTYFDSKNRALYQPWATDLFPEDFVSIVEFNRNIDEIHYIGSIWSENIEFVRDFAKSCHDNGKKFMNHRFISDNESMSLVRKSLISPDIRCQHHVNVGYIPCRVFKNLSYGVIPATNSKFVRDFFGEDLLPYSENCYGLYQSNVDVYSNKDYLKLIEFLQEEVKTNHTYLNRVKSIIDAI